MDSTRLVVRVYKALAWAVCAGALASTACGGGGSPAATTPKAGQGDAGAGAAAKTAPMPSGLPPMAVMPPPGVTGSRKAKKKSEASYFTCASDAKAGGDPAEQVKRMGEACRAATKMHPVGDAMRSEQTDKDTHQEKRFRAEANKCYRVYFASDDKAKDTVVVMRDSAGDMVGESPNRSLPEDGAVCFTTADEVTLLVAVGSGKGAWAMQVWGD